VSEWLQAVGVILAIIISIVTYVVTNRRDDKHWLRDHLLQACVEFLDGSFARYSKRTYLVRMASRNGAIDVLGKLDEYRTRADDGLRRQNAALTHLRLLASDRVVKAAEAVMRADEDVQRRVENPDDKVESWEELNRPRQEARRQFMSAYRREFKLDEAVPIEHPGASEGSG
jgi:hypothetical protein